MRGLRITCRLHDEAGSHFDEVAALAAFRGLCRYVVVTIVGIVPVGWAVVNLATTRPVTLLLWDFIRREVDYLIEAEVVATACLKSERDPSAEMGEAHWDG